MTTNDDIFHSIIMDTRTERGHLIYVIDCPISKKPELIIREVLNGSTCTCGFKLD